MAMRMVELGRTGVEVSALCYGCMRIAGVWDPQAISPEHERAGRAALMAAYEAGYTFFDHADIYSQGECESIHGALLRDEPGLRERTFLATKCGIRFGGDPEADSPHRYDFSRGHILWSCEQSLRRLGVDVIDLYQLHRPDVLMDAGEVAEAFAELKSAGKVRFFGVSNFRPSQVDLLRSALGEGALVVNQIEVSLGHLEPIEDGTLDQCQALGMTPLSWSPVAGGWLAADVYDPGRGWDEHAAALHGAVGLAAKRLGVSRAEVCFAWLLAHPAGIVPIVGTTQASRIREAVGSLDIGMGREDWYRLYLAARGSALP